MPRKRPPCHYCGRQLRDGTHTRDHVVPRSAGGGNEWWNLRSACRECNQQKSSQDWRQHCLFCQRAWELHEGIEGLDLGELRVG